MAHNSTLLASLSTEIVTVVNKTAPSRGWRLRQAPSRRERPGHRQRSRPDGRSRHRARPGHHRHCRGPPVRGHRPWPRLCHRPRGAPRRGPDGWRAAGRTAAANRLAGPVHLQNGLRDRVDRSWRHHFCGGPLRTATGVVLPAIIRTDAALRPGTAGGALVDAGGAIVGLTTPGLLRGLPVAIPIQEALVVARRLAAREPLGRPYLGINVQPVRLAAQQRDQVEDGRGLLVFGVAGGGAAERGRLSRRRSADPLQRSGDSGCRGASRWVGRRVARILDCRHAAARRGAAGIDDHRG